MRARARFCVPFCSHLVGNVLRQVYVMSRLVVRRDELADVELDEDQVE